MTNHQRERYYDSYLQTEVTFNTQVILASGLQTGDIHLTVTDRHFSCVLFACSMSGARVIAEVGDGFSEALGRANNMASLRLSFRQRDERAPVTFFVASRVESLAGYNPQKPHVHFISLEFTQRPPDALIEILGSLLEINANAVRRRDERIVLTPASMKKIGLESKESCVAVGGSPRRCIVRDLSFGGAKVLVPHLGEPQAGKQGESQVIRKLARCEEKADAVLSGSIVRVEDVEGRNDIVALSIQFSSEPPISYTQKINGYFAALGSAG